MPQCKSQFAAFFLELPNNHRARLHHDGKDAKQEAAAERRWGELALAAAFASFAWFALSRAFSATTVDVSLDCAKPSKDYERVLATFTNVRACAVLQTATSAACPKTMHACIDRGFKIVEFTLTTPDCLNHMSDFRKE